MTGTAGTCVVCGNEIASALQRVECVSGQHLMHRGCIASDRCSTCGTPLDVGATDPSDRTNREGNWSEVRGWLIVLIVATAISATVTVVSGVLVILGGLAPAWKVWATASVALGIYGGLCSRWLSSRVEAAPRRTAAYLKAAIVMFVLAAGVATSLGDSYSGMGGGIIPAVGWLIYLSRSRRVRAVYGDPSFGRDVDA